MKMKRKFDIVVLAVLAGMIFSPGILRAQVCDNLISLWRLEESMGNTYADIIGGHTALAITSAPTQVTGKVGKAQSFDGSTDYIQVSDHADFDWANGQSFTVEMWVKLNGISSVENMVFIGRDENGGSVHWWLGAKKTTGQVVFTLIDSNGNFTESLGPNLAIGGWYHIVAIRDAASSTNYLYVNNALVDSDYMAYNGGFEADATLDIGMLNYNGANRFFTPANIDEVALYNVALTADDIDLHYNNGVFGIGYCEGYQPTFLSEPDTLGVVNETFTYEAYATGLPAMSYSVVSGPGSINPSTGVFTWTPTNVSQSGSSITISATNSQGTTNQSFKVYLAEEPTCPDGVQNFYKLDDIGEPYIDFVGGNHGEALNAPTYTTGKFGGAQLFDGVNDGIDLPDDGSYNFNKASSFSFEFWVKTPGSTKNKVCLGRQGTIFDEDTSHLHMWVGVLKNSGLPYFHLRDAHNHEPEEGGITGTTSIADDSWHYVVAVRDGSSRRNYLYVDGVEVAVSEPYTYNNSFGTWEGDPFNIGYLRRMTGTSDYHFNGALDEVAIYTRALSATEISNNYLMSFAGEWHCQPGNYAPIFLTDPQMIAVESQTYTYNIEADDIDEGELLSFTGTTIPGWLTFSDLGNGNALLTGTPTTDHIGSHQVVITVSDGKTPINQEFVLEVVDDPDEPEFTSTPVTDATEDAEYSYQVVATDPDVEDDLVFTAPTIPAWLTFDPVTQILSGTPRNGDVGDHAVSLAVTDGLFTVNQDFTITVSNVNDAPVIMDQSVISYDEDNDFTLTISEVTVIDEDHEQGELTLVVESGINYTFTGNTVTPAPDFNGTLVVNVHAADPIEAGPSYGVSVEILPVNDAPIITSDPTDYKRAIIGDLYSYIFTAEDVDGDVLTMTALDHPSYLVFNPSTGILAGLPTNANYGQDIVALKVSDGELETFQTFTLVTSGPIGIEQDENLVEKVYPVPASDVLNFEFNTSEKATITIVDMGGKMVLQRQVAAGESQVQLDISGLREGSYMFRFQSGDRNVVETFVVNR